MSKKIDHEIMFTKESIESKRREFLRTAAISSSAIPALLAPDNSRAQTYTNSTDGYFFNIKDYGAVGNGTTDDTSSIQAAINAALAAGGGVILFPTGKFLVSGTLTIDSNVTTAHVALQGITPGPVQDGSIYQGGSTILVPPNFSGPTILASYVDAIAIKSLTISSDTPRTSGKAIFLNGTTNAVVEDVHLKNQPLGIHIYAGYGHRINRGHWIIPSGGTGLWLDGDSISGSGNGSNDTYINGISTSGGWAAFRIQNTGGAWMHQCDSISSQIALLIDPIQNQEVLWCFFDSCAFDTASQSNIHIVTQGGKIRGMNFVNCWSASITPPGNGCCTISGDVDGVQFVGHRFLNNPIGNGLWASGVKNIYVDDSVAAGFTNGAGFSFNSCTDFAVRNCRIGPYAAVNPGNKIGIYIGTGCTRYIINGCSIVGNQTNLSDSGTPPKSILSGANLIA